MRIFAPVLVSLCLLGWTSSVSVAQQVVATAEVPRYQQASSSLEEAGTGLEAQEIAIGAAVLGGAFTVGLVAAGSLSGGIVAAGAVALIYTFLP